MDIQLIGSKTKISPRESKIIKIITRLMPNIFYVLQELIKKIRQFDPAHPQTTLAEAEELINSLQVNLYGREKFLIRIFRRFLRKSSIRNDLISHLQSVIKMTKSEARKDPRYSLLLKLMSEVDKHYPYASIITVPRHADPRKTIIPITSPLAAMEQAENSNGEERASAVLEGFRRTVEHLYAPYITTLWHLAYFREGKNLEERPDVMKLPFGTILEAVTTKLSDYPQLFDQRVGWMRNCVTHEIPAYDVRTDSWIMRDGKNQAITIKVEELIALTDDIYQISAFTIARVSQLYLFRNFLLESGLLEILVENLPSVLLEEKGDPERKFEEKITGHISKMFRIATSS